MRWERATSVDLEIFQGNALNAVDGKGRLSVPAFLRTILERNSDARSLYIGVHETDPCLVAYGNSYAEHVLRELERRRLAEEEKGGSLGSHDDRSRGVFGMADWVQYDPSGRVVLHPMIRSEGQIEDQALFVGNGRVVEIWNPKVALEHGGPNLQRIANYYMKQKAAKA